MQITVVPDHTVTVVLDPKSLNNAGQGYGRNAFVVYAMPNVGYILIEQGRYPVSVSYREGGVHIRMRHGPFGRTVQLDRRVSLDLAEDGTAQLLIIAE